MSISVTNIGTNSNTSGATITLTGVTVPAGSLIVVLIEESTSTASPGTVSDGVNTYSLATSGQNNGSGSISSIYYAANATLSSGTITYTKHTSGANTVISAIYATGIATSSPLDGAVTATAVGSSAAPSVTSGTPGGAGELFIGMVACGGGLTITVDVNDGWATPPNGSAIAASIRIAGGSLINMGTGTFTFAPTLSGSGVWFAAALGFKPATAPAITVQNVGTANNSSGTTLALSGVTVPAGSLIVVCVSEQALSTLGSVSDGVNTYVKAIGISNPSRVTYIFYAANAALSSGTITYNKVGTAAAVMSVAYATGIALASPLDGNVAAGSNSAASIASGVPIIANELFVAVVGADSAVTQDLADGWGSPPLISTNASLCIVAGAQVNGGTGTLTFAPSAGGTHPTAMVVGFLPPGAQAPFNQAMAFQPHQVTDLFFPPPPRFIGGRQPYEPAKLPGALVGIPVDNPPFSHRELTSNEIDRRAWWATPNPWVYAYHGDQQPYAPLRMAIGIPGFTTDNPPFNLKREADTFAEIIQAWQPPAWPHVFIGDLQAYAPLRMSSAIPGQSADKPPFNLKREGDQLARILVAWQEPPHPPFDPIPGYSVKFYFTFTQPMVLG